MCCRHRDVFDEKARVWIYEQIPVVTGAVSLSTVSGSNGSTSEI
jgi:hypothetical protein